MWSVIVMKRHWSILALVVCVALLAVGCKEAAQGGSGTEKPDTVDKVNVKENAKQSNLDVIQPIAYGNVKGLNLEPGSTISMIGRGSSSAYWSEVRAGAQRAVDDINAMLGYKGNDKIKLNYSAPETEDNVDDQVNILDEELARYPVAVGIAVVDSSACEVQFDLAAENDIPVVAFDSGTDYHNIVSMIDTDNMQAAATAADKLCDSIEDSGEILLFVHDTKSTSAKEREAGFVDAIAAKHPDVSIAEIYHLDDLENIRKEIAAGAAGTGDAETTEQTEDAGVEITQEEAIQYILEKHPDVKGICTTSEATAKFVIDALKNMEKDDVGIVSFDGGKDQLKRLEDGTLEGLIVQNPYGIGYATIVACARAVLNQGNEAEVNTGYTWVTKDNMKKETIKRMMY